MGEETHIEPVKKRRKKAPSASLSVSTELTPHKEATLVVGEGKDAVVLTVEEMERKEIERRIETGELLELKIGDKSFTFNPREEGMRLSWRKFVDLYISNGFNGTRAYMAVFPDTKNENVAAVKAHELLRNGKVVSLIRRKLAAQEIDDEWVLEHLKEIATYRGDSTIHAATTAILGVAKVRGMLVDTKKVIFDKENPAVFVPPYTAEEKAKFDKQAREMGRITE